MPNRELILELFKGPISVISVGIEKLVEHLYDLDVEVMHTDWKPPAEGNLEILKKLKAVTTRKGDGQ